MLITVFNFKDFSSILLKDLLIPVATTKLSVGYGLDKTLSHCLFMNRFHASLDSSLKKMAVLSDHPYTQQSLPSPRSSLVHLIIVK